MIRHDSKRNENRSANLISRCFERKEKKRKNKQERGYIHSTLKIPLILLATRQSGEPRREITKFILVINEIDVEITLCLNFKILPVYVALSRRPSR